MLRRLELYEHESLRVGERGLTAGDFDALVRFNDLGGRRYFTVGHRTITATGFVGYVEVGQVAIEILPKASRDHSHGPQHWRRALLAMIEVAAGLRLSTPELASQAVARASLLELVAHRFVEEVERLLHEGLARGYRPCEENGPAFRGRLLVARHLRENLVRADRFYVEHQVFDHDVVVNRILRVALDSLEALNLSPGTRARAAVCARLFPEVADVTPTDALFARVRTTRATARYRDALVLARMLLEHRSPQLRQGAAPVFAILFEMDRLWERYVTWLFRHAAPPGTRITAQDETPFWLVPGQPARTLRPDLVAVDAGGHRLLVADAKWKVPDGGPSIGDLRQMFTYNELLATSRALLVYPAAPGVAPIAGRFVDRHLCETLHLELFDERGWSPARMRAQVAAVFARQLDGDASSPAGSTFARAPSPAAALVDPHGAR